MTISNRQVPPCVLIQLAAKAFMTANKLDPLRANGTEDLYFPTSASRISSWISQVYWIISDIGVVI